METAVDSGYGCRLSSVWRDLVILLAAVLLLRLPFLNQPIQGDDIYYLAGAEHAQVDWLHPNHAQYAFQGKIVDMRGHPHPPLNVWVLAMLLAALGDIREIPFHAFYILFSLVAVLAAYAVARRFTEHSLAAALLFAVMPAFVVNGTSLESDLPFVALWNAAIALFIYAVDRRSLGLLVPASAAMALAEMTAYQAIVMVPILAAYLWIEKSRWKIAWLSVLTSPLVFAAWQLYERASSGALPAVVLAGYFSSYGLQQLANKLGNAAALTSHLGWMVTPGLVWLALTSHWIWLLAGCLAAVFLDHSALFFVGFGTGILVLTWCFRRSFLAWWILTFFAASLVIFFAGSARYLLPLGVPLAILSSQTRWRWVGIGVQAMLSLLLAAENYQHWDGYRQFAQAIVSRYGESRIWANSEWGLRFYLEAGGALPLMQGQAVQPGELVVTSELGYPVQFTTGGGRLLQVDHADIVPSIPLRIIGLQSRSGFSTASLGFRPFDVTTYPVDRIRAESVVREEPKLTWLSMDDPAAAQQIISGVYSLEGKWRWTAGKAALLLKSPVHPRVLEVNTYVPEPSPVRVLRVYLDGKEVATQAVAKPGEYRISTNGPVSGSVVSLEVDRTFSPPGDSRDLGVILVSAGFR